MATVMPLESVSIDARPQEMLSPFRTGEQPELPLDRTQALSANGQDVTSLQSQLPSIFRKWVYYTASWAMLFTSLTVIIAGMTSRQETGWGFAFIACYVCWTLAVTTCLCLNFSKPDSFLKDCASHLLCCALTLYFFAAALHISSTDLPMYIPLGVNLGLLLSAGVKQIPLPTKMQILSYLGLGNTYTIVQQSSILPLVETSLRPDSPS